MAVLKDFSGAISLPCVASRGRWGLSQNSQLNVMALKVGHILARRRKRNNGDIPALAGPDWRRMRRVTVETERTLIFRSRSRPQVLWCACCEAEVEMASVETAAHEIGLTELAIYELVESGHVHFNEDAKGRVLVCLNSLIQKGKKQ